MTEEIYAIKKIRYIWYSRFWVMTDDDIGDRIKSFYIQFSLPQNIIYNYNYFDHLWR